MTKYEHLIDMKDKAERKALEMRRKNEIALALFYMKGAQGFERKAKALTIEEANEKFI